MPTWQRLLCAVLCGIAGLVVFATMVARDTDGMGILAVLGAATAGGLNAGFFGKSGRVGLLHGFLGAALTTLLGAALAGMYLAIMVVFTGSFAAIGAMPFMALLAVVFVASAFAMPQVVAVWAFAMTIVHLMMWSVRSA